MTFFLYLPLKNYTPDIFYFLDAAHVNLNLCLIGGLLLLAFLTSDLILSYFSNKWKDLSASIYDPTEASDSLVDFVSLDQNTVQVVTDTKIKFADIAGNEEAKAELKEIVKFLKEPKNFVKVGAGVPKGILLGGPPGTGKTLLARAIAGEAGVPFLKVSGSEFVQLLVGVGASRVRELFEKARTLKPCIIFIDEIDSIARTRSGNNNMSSVNDEREQTLNQILIEMDGFELDTGVIVVAASNRIDILDPAIKRAGRFDRQILITYPNLKERVAILKVHSRGKKLDKSVSLSQVAQRTIGFSGADLANLLNEAAILATRGKKENIKMFEINQSADRVLLGLESKQVTRIKSRQITGFHEIGHAFVGSLITNASGMEKLTLLTRGSTQGSAATVPTFNQYSPRNTFINQIFISLSGRAAEESIGGIGECTISGQEDLAGLTRNVRIMILKYAMSKLQELKQHVQQRNLYFLGSDAKQELNNFVDNFTTNFIDITYQELLLFIEVIRPAGERLVDELLASEELTGSELRAIAKEFFSTLSTFEILYRSRQSSMFDLVAPDLEKVMLEIEP
jgi:cell division protease FtsH